MNHESKCRNLHGHNYVAFFYAEADCLDSIGRIIDFSVLKEKLGGWIDRNWDHTMIVYQDDQEIRNALSMVTFNKPPFISDFNPTAENMALYLLNVVSPVELMGTGVRITKVVLFETENCSAEVSLEPLS
jgi:6-pyruvoyltetrahydropterin/6-carboxytetrahydropterin synthase